MKKRYRFLPFVLILIFSLFCFLRIPKVYTVPLKTITYDQTNNIMTAYDANSSDPFNFEDLHLRDIMASDGRILLNETIQSDPDIFSLDEQPKPADYLALPLEFHCSARLGAYVDINGTDAWGNIHKEWNIDISGGWNETSLRFRTVRVDGIHVFGLQLGDNFDVYQNRLGVVWKTGESQFMFDCRIVIGDSSTTTWFIDTSKQVTFNDGIVTANSQYLIEAKRYAHIELGVLEDATNKITSNGVSFISLESTYNEIRFIYTSPLTGGETNLYSCSFASPQKAYESHTDYVQTNLVTDKIYHCIFTKATLPFMATGDFYDIIVQKAYYGLYASGTMERIWIGECDIPLFARYSPGVTLKNVIVRGTYDYLWKIVSKTTNPIYAINVEAPEWNITWIGTSTVNLYRQYEFDLTVFYDGAQIENANVTISNDYLGTSNSWLSFANGSIPSQIYNMGHYNQTGGNTIYDYNPYNLTVTLDGYQTYDDLINITRKEDLRISLTSIEENEQNFVVGLGGGAILGGLLFLVLGIAIAKKKG